jgi:hypothetical protein
MKTMKNSLSTPLSKRLFRPCKKFGKYVLKFLARTKISFWKGKKSLGGGGLRILRNPSTMQIDVCRAKE